MTAPDRADERLRQDRAADRRRALRERTLMRLFQHGRLLIIEQEVGDAPDLPPPAGVTIAPFAGPDWALLARAGQGRSAARFRRVAARGRVCLAAWRDGRVIGYTWMSEAISPAIEGVPFTLPPGAAYGWNLYVTPAERANGIGSALLAARLRWARELGYRTMWRAVAPTNVASLKTVARTAPTGTRVHGELRYLKLGPWWWSALRPAAPWP